MRDPKKEKEILTRLRGSTSDFAVGDLEDDVDVFGDNDPKEDAFSYIQSNIGGRWPEFEPFIMKDADAAFYYARDIIKGRWPEAEPYIVNDTRSAYYYARYVIRGRWPEFETFGHLRLAMDDPFWACLYASKIIKGRWLEAEPYIMKDSRWWDKYVSEVINA